MSDSSGSSRSKAAQAARKQKRPSGASRRGGGFGNGDVLDMMRGTEGQGFSKEDIRITPEFMSLLQSDRSLEQNPELSPELAEQTEEQRVNGKATPDQGPLATPMMGAVRDASLFAAMIALARTNPDLIRDIVKDNGDGTYDVTLHMRDDMWSMKASPQIVTVDARFPMEAGSQDPLYAEALRGEDGPELWAMLIEKAFAIYNGSWANIAEEEVGQDPLFPGAMSLLTGSPENTYDLAEIPAEKAQELIQLALSRGWAITATARNLEDEEDDVQHEADRHTIVSGHTYSPDQVDAKQKKIDMKNPWGAGHIKGLDTKDFPRFFSQLRLVRQDGPSKRRSSQLA